MTLRELFEAHEWRHGYFCACGAEMNSHTTWRNHLLELWEKETHVAMTMRTGAEVTFTMGDGIDPVVPFPVVTEGAFDTLPQCAICQRVIEVGQPFQSAIQNSGEGGIVVTVLMCVYCDPSVAPVGIPWSLTHPDLGDLGDQL